jgi:hypothetical protein
LEILHLIEILRRDKAEEIIIYVGNYYLYRKHSGETRQRTIISYTHIEAEEIIIYIGNYYLHRQGRG